MPPWLIIVLSLLGLASQKRHAQPMLPPEEMALLRELDRLLLPPDLEMELTAIRSEREALTAQLERARHYLAILEDLLQQNAYSTSHP